jgi:hypothetical protein
VRGSSGAGPWQIEPGSNRPPPYAGESLPELTHAARQALWLWRHSWQCGHSPEARFRAYAGTSCSSAWAGAHARTQVLFFATSYLKRLAQ